MPNTYSQVHIHFVFAVKYREGLISPEWKERLHQYIAVIFRDDKHKVLQINSMSDHIHILIGMRTHQSISVLIQKVKSETTKWVHAERLCSRFAWQEGYGAFSYAKSQLPSVIRYIQNQEVHHRKKTFLDEYRHFLNVFEVEWEEGYIFAEPQ
jgi:putative transposase